MPATFLESDRLWYRAPEKSDVPFLTSALLDPRVRRNLLVGRYPFSEAGEEKWIERHAQPPAVDGVTDVVMVFGPKGSEQPLGSTGLHRISMLHRSAEWGIFIGRPEEWGKGYGREVARGMLRYGFDTLNLHRIHLRVNADNERGIKAYRAAGFIDEGRQREASYVEGKYVDLVLMAVLRHEWRKSVVEQPSR
ncbi:MAG: GNAT family N-acetyltransferase [Planctomycetes bacterium]|nr:GNAT family N-acetyltransferase [Planctomycetota bacterium]